MKFGNDIFIGDEIITIHGVTGVIIRYNKESYEYTIVNIDKQKGRVYYVPECEVVRTTGKYCPQILDLFDNGAHWKLSSSGSDSQEINKGEDLYARELYIFTKGLMAFGRCVQELRRFKNDDWVKFAKLTESYQLKISTPEVPTDVTILDRLLEDNRPDKIYEAYRGYKKAIADERFFAHSYNVVKSADYGLKLVSGEDAEAKADSSDYGELWAALKYISAMSIEDRFDLFDRNIRDLETLLYDFSPEEIIDTVNQHTKRIHVGDELYFKHVGNIFETLVSVLDVSDYNHDEFCVVILEPNGRVSARMLRYNQCGIYWEKTGNNNTAITTLLTTLRKHQSERNNRKDKKQ